MKMLPIIAMAVLIASAGAGAQTEGINNVLSIANLGMLPKQAVAGGNITLSFQLFNSYSQSLSNVNLWLVSPSQIFNVTPSQTYLINAIGTGLYGGNGYNIFTYTLHLPQTLSTGLYTIEVMASYEAQNPGGITYTPGMSEMPITIYVYGKPKLGINAVPAGEIAPGTSLPLNLQISNTGTGTARNITLQLESGNGFDVLGQSKFYINTIPEGGEQEAQANIYIDSNISAGVHNLTLYATYQGDIGKYNQSIQIPMRIVIENPTISASIVGSTPPQLFYGYNQTVQIAIQNIGSGIARNVTASIYSSNTIEVKNSASRFTIGTLMPGQAAIESVMISPYNATLAGELPVQISYEEANYANKSSFAEYLPISIARTGEFKVVGVSSSLYPGIGYGPITVELKNIGNAEINDSTISLQTIYPISPLVGSAYISSIAPNQTANITFYVSVDSNGNSGNYPIILYEQWTQSNLPNGQMLTSSNTYYARVGDAASNAYAYYAIAIALVIIAIVIGITRRKRSRKKQKSNE
ncbi:MAG: hypothetical protein QXY10_00850 [Candidatus Micrarchaeaceae archaeon]